MKIIGILSSFSIVLVMTVMYVNHMSDMELQHLQMQLQIENTVAQVLIN
jgi:hypothetical protein